MLFYRLLPCVFLLTIAAAETHGHADTLAILNTADHAVVIGVYEHTENGIKERLVPVGSMTEVRNVPVSYNGSSHFAIAYRAESKEGTIGRAVPVVIHGMRKIYQTSDRQQTDRRETVLQYRAGRLYPERDSFGTNLYAARGDGRSIRKEVRHAYGDRMKTIDYQDAK